MIDILFTIPAVFVLGILIASAYRWYNDEKKKKK